VVHLDEGFEIMYEKLARELEGNRERYAAQIRELQKKVSRVTELSVTVQAQEARNKKLIESYFARERAGILAETTFLFFHIDSVIKKGSRYLCQLPFICCIYFFWRM